MASCQLEEVWPVPASDPQTVEDAVKRYSTGVLESEPTVEDMLTVDVPVSFGSEANVMGLGVGGSVSPPGAVKV